MLAASAWVVLCPGSAPAPPAAPAADAAACGDGIAARMRAEAENETHKADDANAAAATAATAAAAEDGYGFLRALVRGARIDLETLLFALEGAQQREGEGRGDNNDRQQASAAAARASGDDAASFQVASFQVDSALRSRPPMHPVTTALLQRLPNILKTAICVNDAAAAAPAAAAAGAGAGAGRAAAGGAAGRAAGAAARNPHAAAVAGVAAGAGAAAHGEPQLGISPRAAVHPLLVPLMVTSSHLSPSSPLSSSSQ